MTTRTSTAVRPLLAFLIALLAVAALSVALPARAHATNIVTGGDSAATNDPLKSYPFTIKETTDVNFTIKGVISPKDAWGDSYVGAAVYSVNPYSQKFVVSAWRDKPKDEVTKQCLWPGEYVVRAGSRNHTTVDQFTNSYNFVMSVYEPSVNFNKSGGQFTVPKTQKYKEPTPKKIYFTYDSTTNYFYDRSKVTTSNSKVAKVQVGDYDRSGNGYLKFTPKKLGKATITLKLGPKSTKFTAYVTKTKNTVNVAKGKKVQLKKPLGVGSVKFKSKNSKIASVTKAGKVTGKKKGKTTVYAKKGKYTYSYTVVVKDKGKLKAA